MYNKKYGHGVVASKKVLDEIKRNHRQITKKKSNEETKVIYVIIKHD